MTSKSTAEDSECDDGLTLLWQSDVQQLLSLGVDLGLQSPFAHAITKERTGEAASRTTFLRMKLFIKELDARLESQALTQCALDRGGSIKWVS